MSVDPRASDTRDFVSTWLRDPTARPDDRVAARVQLRSVERVAKRRDAQRRAHTQRDEDTECAMVVDDAGGDSGFSDGEARALRRHTQATSLLMRVRPLSASHVRPSSARHGNAPHRSLQRPQSATASRRTPNVDGTWIPTAIPASKWTERLRAGPRFQEPTLQQLEAETYALLQQVLRGPTTTTVRPQRRSLHESVASRPRTTTTTATTLHGKEKIRPAASTSARSRSAGCLAVGSAFQVARNNQKVAPHATRRNATAHNESGAGRIHSHSRPATKDGTRRLSSREQRAVVEKTKARSASAASSRKTNTGNASAVASEKEQKKRQADAEASAKVMREMGWLDDLAVCDASERQDARRSKEKKRGKRKPRVDPSPCRSEREQTDSVPVATSGAVALESDYCAHIVTAFDRDVDPQQDDGSTRGPCASELNTTLPTSHVDERTMQRVDPPDVRTCVSTSEAEIEPGRQYSGDCDNRNPNPSADRIRSTMESRGHGEQYVQVSTSRPPPVVGEAQWAHGACTADIVVATEARSQTAASQESSRTDGDTSVNASASDESTRTDPSFPDTEAECTDSPTKPQEAPDEQLSESGSAQGASQRMEDPLQNGEREATSIIFQLIESQQSRGGNQSLSRAATDQSSAHVELEDPNEPVAADEYGDEHFDEEIELPPTESGCADYHCEQPQGELEDATELGVSGDGDSVRCVSETRQHGINSPWTGFTSTTCSVIETEISGARRLITNRGTVESHSVQPESSSRAADFVRAAEVILRQYRAFCNRRILLEQVKFLSRKTRRNKRRKTRDPRSRPDSESNTRDSRGTLGEARSIAVQDVAAVARSLPPNVDRDCVENAREDPSTRGIEMNVVASGSLGFDTGQLMKDSCRAPDVVVGNARNVASEGGDSIRLPELLNTTAFRTEHVEMHQSSAHPGDEARECASDPVVMDHDVVQESSRGFLQSVVRQPTSSLDDVLATDASTSDLSSLEHPQRFEDCEVGAVNDSIDEGVLQRATCRPVTRDDFVLRVETGRSDEDGLHDELKSDGGLDTDQPVTESALSEARILLADAHRGRERDSVVVGSPECSAVSAIDQDSSIHDQCHDDAVETGPIEALHVHATVPLLNKYASKSHLSGTSLVLTREQPASGGEDESLESLTRAVVHELNSTGSVALDVSSADADDSHYHFEPATLLNDSFTDKAAVIVDKPQTDPTGMELDRNSQAESTTSLSIKHTIHEAPHLSTDITPDHSDQTATSAENEISRDNRLANAPTRIERAWREYGMHTGKPTAAVHHTDSAAEENADGEDDEPLVQEACEHVSTSSLCNREAGLNPTGIKCDPRMNENSQDPLVGSDSSVIGMVVDADHEDVLARVTEMDGCQIDAWHRNDAEVSRTVDTCSPQTVFEPEHLPRDATKGDRDSIRSELESHTEALAHEAATASQHDAALRVQRQYRRQMYRRDVLDQLTFFVRQHRRESRKKSRRLSGARDVSASIGTRLNHEVEPCDPAQDLMFYENRPGGASTLPRLAEDSSILQVGVAETALDSIETPAPGGLASDDVLADRHAVVERELSADGNNCISNDDGEVVVGAQSSSILAHQPMANDEHQSLAVHDVVNCETHDEPLVVEAGDSDEQQDASRAAIVDAAPVNGDPSASADQWERYMDSGANKSFYYSPQRRLSRWDRPVGDHVVDRTLESSVLVTATEQETATRTVDVELEHGELDAQANRWERYKDSETNKTFYFNPTSQVARWDRPDDVTMETATVETATVATSNEIVSHDAGRDEDGNGHAASPDTSTAATAELVDAERTSADDGVCWTLRRNCSLRGDRRGEWQAFVDAETHQTFYYNTVSGESSWDKPTAFLDTSSPTKTAAGPGHNEWVLYVDAVTAQPYYVNLVTNATSWEKPVDFDAAVCAQDLSRRLRGIGESSEHQERLVMSTAAEAAASEREDGDDDDDQQDDYLISLHDDDAEEWLTL